MLVSLSVGRLSIALVLLSVFSSNTASAPLAKQLEIVRTTVHQFEGGPSIPGDFEFFPGDTVFLSFRISGYRMKSKNNQEETIHLSYQIDALDPDGLRLKDQEAGTIETDLLAQDIKRNWTPVVWYSVLVPPGAPMGGYKLIIHAKDELSNQTTEQEVDIRVRGVNVEPSDTLVVRNFRFLRSEMAARPLVEASYRPGDSLWARFIITGYKLTKDNHFSVDYGLSVLRSDGKELYTQELAAAEERSSYYPQRHIEGSLSLSLTPDLALGEYTLVLSVRDRIGEQTCQNREVFRVE